MSFSLRWCSLLLAGCGATLQTSAAPVATPTRPPVLYWELQVGDGMSERLPVGVFSPIELGNGWRCEMEEVQRYAQLEEGSYAEYRAVACSRDGAFVRARAGCRLKFGRGMTFRSAASLQLADAVIGAEQRWEYAGQLREQALDDPQVVVPTVPPYLLLQCLLDRTVSDAGWAN